jgi:GNAT superfamily N-acetyltransferase
MLIFVAINFYAMTYSIRPAQEADFPAILSIIKELALFEKAPEQVTNSVEQMLEEKDCFRCFVAVDEHNEVLAISLYFFAYYTWVGKSLYLDDLYVREPFRKQGIASSLLKKIFEVAREENCKRVRWQVLNWNVTAIKLYEKCGATIDNEWSNCDFDRQGILEFSL